MVDGSSTDPKELAATVQELFVKVAVLEAVSPGQLQRIEDRISAMVEKLDGVKNIQAIQGGKLERIDAWRYALPLSGLALLVSAVAALAQVLGG